MARSLSNAIKAEPATGLVQGWSHQLQAHLANSESSQLDDFRRRALAALNVAGRLPGRKDEHWKYFSLQRLETLNPELNLPRAADGAALPPGLLAETNACRLRLRIGSRMDPAAVEPVSMRQGLQLLRLQEALEAPGLSAAIRDLLANENLQGAGQVFRALNTAALDTALDNTLVVHVARDVDAGRLHIDWLPALNDIDAHSGWLDNDRIFIILEPGSRLQLLESFSSNGNSSDEHTSILNQVTQVQLGEGAAFDHLRVQMAASGQHLFQFCEVNQAVSSEYRYTGFEMGGGLVRNVLASRLQGEGASADLAAAFIGKGESCIDHHLLVDHASPGCRSEQNFRGVLGGRSRGVFNGKALIRPGADGSSVRQSNANLLLSDVAEMNTKPELEIYADEVEASHGATVGQLDERALFYLRSRGLAEGDARRMLTGAFCRAIGARLPDRKLVEQIEALLDAAMPAMEESSEDTA